MYGDFLSNFIKSIRMFINCNNLFILTFAFGHLFLTNVTGQSWVQVADVDSVEILSITVHEGNLFAQSPNDIFKGTEKGDNWQKIANEPQTISSYTSIYSYDGCLYIGTLNDGVFCSTNSGDEWEKINTGLSNGALGIVGFAGRGDSLYIGTNASGIYVLNLLSPTSWQSFNTGLFRFGTTSIYAANDILLANLGLYFFVRSNSDIEWNNVFLDTLEIARSIYEFISAGDYIFAGTDNGVYRGSLDADNWESADIASFPGQDIGEFALYGTRLFAALLIGEQHWIFSSDDYGETWEIRAHEFVWLNDMTVFENRLWCSRTDGLWFTDLNIPTDIEEPGSDFPNEFVLKQNYPNPFNPNTKIEFSIPNNLGNENIQSVQLKIYDILGREVSVLINEFIHPGSYSINFNSAGLSSGIYFYKLTAGNFTLTKKMTIIK